MFWIIAFALAWAITAPLAANQMGWADFGSLPFGLAFLVGLAPGVAALVAAPLDKRWGELWRNVTRVAAPVWVYLAAVALPALLLVAPFAWAAIAGAEPPRMSFTPEVAVFAALWFVLAFGEEMGWRGYALPRLVARHGFVLAATILGVVWCVWHYPRLLASPYIENFEQALPWLGLFSLQIVLANFVICWIAARARYGVLAPTIFHTGFNIAATVHPTAAIDPAVTAAIALMAALILLFDRKPQPVVT
jgi:membrane protease YdiL (CAAX protease family)